MKVSQKDLPTTLNLSGSSTKKPHRQQALEATKRQQAISNWGNSSQILADAIEQLQNDAREELLKKRV